MASSYSDTSASFISSGSICKQNDATKIDQEDFFIEKEIV